MQSETHCSHSVGEERICGNKTCRLEIYQCLRTSLVEHPEDLRGRRRANLARQILESDIFYERGFVYKMEMFLNVVMTPFYAIIGRSRKYAKAFLSCSFTFGKLW